MHLSIGRRFSCMLIGVMTLILAGFAAFAISTNVSRVNAQLVQNLAQIATIAQRSLKTPVWNLEEETIHDIVEAILASNGMVHVSIVTNEDTVSTRSRPPFDNQEASYFADAPEFLVTTVDIRHDNETIGRLNLAMDRERVQQEIRHHILRILALALLILLATSVTLIVLTRRYIARPLAELGQVATLIAQGNLDVTVAIRSRDEIGRLAQALDGMQRSLKRLFEAVQQASGQVASSATQLAASSQRLDAKMTEQVASTHEVVLTTKEIASHMTMVASTANDASSNIETVAAGVVDDGGLRRQRNAHR